MSNKLWGVPETTSRITIILVGFVLFPLLPILFITEVFKEVLRDNPDPKFESTINLVYVSVVSLFALMIPLAVVSRILSVLNGTLSFSSFLAEWVAFSQDAAPLVVLWALSVLYLASKYIGWKQPGEFGTTD